MIDYIKGIVEEISENYIVLDNNDKGYIIFMPSEDINSIKLYDSLKIHTRFIVREDSMTLYGFINRDKRTLFDLVTTVSSVGPKVGMGILSSLSVKDIIKSIYEKNVKVLSSAPGVGKKTAERIILELKDKIGKYEFDYNLEIEDFDLHEVEVDVENPAVDALMNLGYSRYEAKNALTNVDINQPVSKIIKEALKNLGR